MLNFIKTQLINCLRSGRPRWPTGECLLIRFRFGVGVRNNSKSCQNKPALSIRISSALQAVTHSDRWRSADQSAEQGAPYTPVMHHLPYYYPGSLEEACAAAAVGHRLAALPPLPPPSHHNSPFFTIDNILAPRPMAAVHRRHVSPYLPYPMAHLPHDFIGE